MSLSCAIHANAMPRGRWMDEHVWIVVVRGPVERAHTEDAERAHNDAVCL